MSEIDHITLGLSRLAFQFSESTRLKGLISAIMEQGNDIEAAHESTLAGRALNTATGSQLDVIGEIVGQSRTTLAADDGDFFGFWDGTTPNSYLGFSSNGVNDGGVFWDGNATLASRSLSDAEYLRFIDSKILRNKARGTHREIVTAIKFLLGDDTELNVQDSTPGTISIGVSRVLNDAEQAILTDSGLVPISAGIGIESWYAYVPTFALGLSDSATGYFPTGAIGLGNGATLAPTGIFVPVDWLPNAILVYSGGGAPKWVRPLTANGYVYLPTHTGVIFASPSGYVEPDWNQPLPIDDVGGSVDWLPNTFYPANAFIRPQNGHPDRRYVASIGGGTSGATEPIWPSAESATVLDGTVDWIASNIVRYSTRALDPANGGILASAFE